MTGWQNIDGLQYYFDGNGKLSSCTMIDVSTYNGDIDWNAVKAAGVDYAIIRVGYRGYGTARLVQDRRFEQNMRGAINAGIRVGAYIVTQAVLKLAAGEEQAIRARMKELATQRAEKQPLEYPSAGSTFKRPEGYFAGKLIMDAGLRGYRVGGAQVSQKHCGFVVNTGNATAQDVRTLIADVSAEVDRQFQVKLEPEIKMLGEF